jgi:exodeoxyribonuclease VII small subunit
MVNNNGAGDSFFDGLTFEQAMQELESIVKKLEAGNIGLEVAIDHYTKGVALKKHCQSLLDDAKLKIDRVVVEDGKGKALEESELQNMYNVNQ